MLSVRAWVGQGSYIGCLGLEKNRACLDFGLGMRATRALEGRCGGQGRGAEDEGKKEKREKGQG